MLTTVLANSDFIPLIALAILVDAITGAFKSLLWIPEMSLLPVIAGTLIPALIYMRAFGGFILLVLLLAAWYVGFTGLIAAFDGYGIHDRDMLPVLVTSLVLMGFGASLSAGAYITPPSWRSSTSA
jgi:hypothetical protein